MILNCRPLTYIEESEEIQTLTPSHLFYGRRIVDPNLLKDVVDDPESEFELNRSGAINQMKHVNQSVDHFWKRWVKEYLIGLRETHKLKGRRSDISVGDFVIIHENGVKRHKWKVGKIERLIKGNDDVIRGAELAYKIDGKEHKISRPLQLLYPLEINERHVISRQQEINMKEKKEENDITENKNANGTIRENTREIEREEILNEGDTRQKENSKNVIAEEEIDRLVAASPK